MGDLYLDKLSATNANWLSVRQSLISSNVANANTYGYKALDVKAMDDSSSPFRTMMQTQSNHIQTGIQNSAGVGIEEDVTWEITHSGNTVSLPQEMVKAGEVANGYQLNTSVMKSFHRMVLTVFGT